MKTIRLTIDETLLADIDRAADELGIERSHFVHNALQAAVQQQMIEQAERRHTAGYAAQPSSEEDVAEWVGEQIWGDA